jgi:hypothetical protein
MKAPSLIWTRDAAAGGTSLRGYLDPPFDFEETVARLITVSGQPAESSDDYKTSVEFVGIWKGRTFTLYDYKEDRQIHIGGGDHLDVEGLRGAVLDAIEDVTPTPYEAREYYDRQRGHAWPKGNPIMKFNVHLYVSVRVKVANVEAASQLEAVEKAVNGVDLGELINRGGGHSDQNGFGIESITYAEDITDALVDVARDTDLSGSQWFAPKAEGGWAPKTER